MTDVLIGMPSPLKTLSENLKREVQITAELLRTEKPAKNHIKALSFATSSIKGVIANLEESAVHLLEVKNLYAQIRESFKEVIKLEPRTHQPTEPMKMDLEDFEPKLLRIQINASINAFLSATTASSDCLASAAILILNINIPPTSSLNSLLRIASEQKTVGSELQQPNVFLQALTKAKDSAGPQDWLNWSRALRDVFSHRSRWVWANSIVPISSDYPRIYSNKGEILVSTTCIWHLPSIPKLNFPSIADGSLDEHLTDTLNGLLVSQKQMISDFSGILLKAMAAQPDWAKRTSQKALAFPKEQKFEFKGYKGHPIKSTHNRRASLHLDDLDIQRLHDYLSY